MSPFRRQIRWYSILDYNSKLFTTKPIRSLSSLNQIHWQFYWIIIYSIMYFFTWHTCSLMALIRIAVYILLRAIQITDSYYIFALFNNTWAYSFIYNHDVIATLSARNFWESHTIVSINDDILIIYEKYFRINFIDYEYFVIMFSVYNKRDFIKHFK